MDSVLQIFISNQIIMIMTVKYMANGKWQTKDGETR